MDSECLRCVGEILGRQGPGLDRGDVAVDRMLAQTGSVVLDLDKAEDVRAGRFVGFPDGGPDFRFQQTEKAFSCGVIATWPGSPHALPKLQLPY